jgi:polysaccharide export outer membrane protein
MLMAGFVFTAVASAVAQQPAKPATGATATAAAGGVAPTVAPAFPTGYVIGANDVLSIVFWRDKDMSADVVVRPDGKISLPLLNDVQAAGYTPEQLRVALVNAATNFIEEPNATVVVREIHSRNVFITGSVAKPGTYPMSRDMTVLQLIATAGGLQEFADAKNITVIGMENGRTQYHKFNYSEVVKHKRTEQNILLKPDDTVVVP